MLLHKLKKLVLIFAKKVTSQDGVQWYSMLGGIIKGKRIYNPERLSIVVCGVRFNISLRVLRAIQAKLVSRRNLKEERLVLSRILKLGESHNEIIIYKHHIGEIFIFLNCLQDYLHENKISNPLLLVLSPRYVDLFASYADKIEIKVDQIPGSLIDKVLTEELLIKDGVKVYCPTPNRFLDLREMIMLGTGIHFTKYIAKSLHIGSCSKIRSPNFDEHIVRTAEQKAKEIGLNINNFIFLCPDATTASTLRESFWVKVGEILRSKGFDILINSYPEKPWHGRFKRADLSIMEALYLASKSKGCIALASGFVVCMAAMEITRIILYTQQTPTVGYRMNANEMLSAYAMRDIPGAITNNLYEINADSMYESDLLDTISNII